MIGILLLLSIFYAIGAQALPEQTCSRTTWEKTYNQADYVAVVKVTGLEVKSIDSYRLTFVEDYRFKGSQAPFKLQISMTDFMKNPMWIGSRYMIASLNDGVLNECNSFSRIDGEFPSGDRYWGEIEPSLVGKLLKLCTKANHCPPFTGV